MTEKTRKLRFIDENRTKGLQKDWQGYGKSQALFGIVVMIDDEDRENEGDVICAAEFATNENVNFMASYAKGLICMPMSEEYTEKFLLPQMCEVNTDNHCTAFTVSIDHVDTKTGISAYERSITAMKFVEDDAKPSDFRTPGHMFPLKAKKGGVLERNGHTEATVDIVRLAGLKPVGLCCEIMKDDGTMARTPDLVEFAKNHEKEVLAEIARQYGIEWEQKGTHEEHLDVYNFKKKERKKEVQELEQEKEHLTAEKEELTAQIAESRADIQNLKDDKEQAIKAKQEAEQKAGSAEKELKSLEDRREQLQPIMDSVSKEIKEYGTVKMLLPEAGTLERAVTYRDKKIKPLFLQIKNKVAVMAAQVKELTKEVEGWKKKYQKVKQKYNAIQRELDDIRKDNQKLSEEKDILQGVSDRYDRVVRVLGIETVDTAVQQDIQNEKVLEEKRRMEQMPKGNIHERLAWGMKKSEMENQQRKKTKSKNREMER